MEAMDIDEETVVDLSVSSRRPTVEMPTTPFPPPRSGIVWPQRRSLRPRTEHRSYAESPDIVIVSDEEPRTNGIINGNIGSDEEELAFPPLMPIKELTEQQILDREKTVRKLRDELRNEEMALVLLKKLRQSHQLKENIAVVAPCANQTPPQVPVHTKPVPPRTSSKPSPAAQPVHLLNRPGLNSRTAPPIHPPPPALGNRGAPPSMPTPLTQGNTTSNSSPRGPVGTISVRNLSTLAYAPGEKRENRNAPVSYLIPPPPHERARVAELAAAAERQAAAKAALRKQLEKTLLQISPPKPPPPEMLFVPSPSNSEFIYLVGLEHVVDFITKDSSVPPPPEPSKCSQCSTTFTPVWKWEKVKGKESRAVCEECVSTNLKASLKNEHTNRLKAAFVKALQQEQEMERLLQVSPKPEPPQTPLPAPPPPPPPPPQPVVVKPPTTPKPAPPVPSPTRDHLSIGKIETKFNPHHVAATIQQQILRGLPQHQPLPAHMLPFSPLLYPYQLAMAQAAGGKGSVAAAAANLVELQRQAADLQRQYLLDMIPAPNAGRHSINNWKT